MATPNPPSKLILVRRYLAFRRSLGYRMRNAELLFDFARLAEREAPGKPLTTALAVRWATTVPSARLATDYTARLLPHYDGVAIPLEEARILWQR